MVKHVVVTSQQVAECPLHILALKHWIPVHHVEECNPRLRELAAARKKELNELKARDLKKVREKYDALYESFVLYLRRFEKKGWEGG